MLLLNLHHLCHSPWFIYISTEFKEERKVLLEVIGPELQSIYDDKQIEVCKASNDIRYHYKVAFVFVQIEIVDMHFGTGLTHTTVDLDPYVLFDHLREIRACYRASRSTFFIVSQCL